MDPLLRLLEESGLGLTVNGLYSGGYLHADDIRTLASGKDSLMRQIDLVKQFASENFLMLNVDKCEIMMFGMNSGSGPGIESVIDDYAVPCVDVWVTAILWPQSPLKRMQRKHVVPSSSWEVLGPVRVI